jgi:exopolysaccharide biosynthesis WecB/TagA/CpsF family protein
MPFPTAFAYAPFSEAAGSRDSETLRFGAFPITETLTFPPQHEAACWAYVPVNAEVALSLPRNAALQRLIASRRALFSVDGQWIWWALRRKYPERPLRKLPGSELIYTLAAHCAQEGRRLLLLGSTPKANAGAVQRLRQRWPGLAVAGYAPAQFTPGEDSEAVMLQAAMAAIEAQRPDYVVLGFGVAKEHRFALQMLPRLDGRVSGLLCFGGAIDMASGQIRRAPLPWQRLGLEGVYRLIQQPSRLGRFLDVLRVLPVLARAQY